jgi:hypothetical protein
VDGRADEAHGLSASLLPEFHLVTNGTNSADRSFRNRLDRALSPEGGSGRGRMELPKSELYREHAAACARQAKLAPEGRIKEAFLDLEQQWLRLAAEAAHLENKESSN